MKNPRKGFPVTFCEYVAWQPETPTQNIFEVTIKDTYFIKWDQEKQITTLNNCKIIVTE